MKKLNGGVSELYLIDRIDIKEITIIERVITEIKLKRKYKDRTREILHITEINHIK